MRVCVVGAGAAGMCAARHISTIAGVSVTVYEQTTNLGGTWVYTEDTHTDSLTGLPVHTSLYKSVRTNLPKEVMGFPDFPFPAKEKSYLPAADILEFLNQYTENFRLRPLIKFLHHVVDISPLEQNEWIVKVKKLQTKEEMLEVFDAIMICNGHYHCPRYPSILGQSTFPGLVLHSHHYRVPEPLADKTVVILGAGPSGMDLTLEVAAVAKQVILSHHLQEQILTKFPDNVHQKPDVSSISGSAITFKDGTEIVADVLFYCTGYHYNFPFLNPKCGVTVNDNCVQPLYKHLIHAYKPTMCFIGLPYYVCAFTMFDIQVQYFKKVLQGSLRLPSLEDMLRHTACEMEENRQLGLRLRQFHMMGPRQAKYYDSLTSEAGLPSTPPVLTSLHNHSSQRFIEDLLHFRDDQFAIIDHNTYLSVK